MTKENDSDELAKRFLDLWQDQAQAVAADLSEQGGWSKVMRDFGFPVDSMGMPDSAAGFPAAQWAAWPAMMAAAAAAAGKTAGTGAGDSASAGEESQDENESRRRTSPSGTKAASAPSGDGLHDLDQLLRRIDALEKRLAALESEKPRRRQRKKPKET